MPVRSAWLVDAVRTPVGRKKGALAGAHPADLGAHVLKALLERTGVDPAAVEDVVFGCVDTLGPQAGDVARTCWLAAGLPDHVPGVTVDRQCGSGQQAVHFAAQGVLSGTQDLVIAGGVQNMAMIPIGQAMVAGQALGFADPFSGSTGWQARYGDQPVDQFRSAERIAEKWGCSREDLHAFAYESHRRAIVAQDEGRFAAEIVPFGGVDRDEGPRRDTSPEGMAKLEPVIPGGRHTAAASSQLSVAASAVLVASDEAVRTHGLKPLARVHHLSVRADDPVWMLTAPIPATRHALRKAGMSLDDIDHVEINEAFAAVVLAWCKELDADRAKVNPLGGAIALGHPLGATGARLLTTMLHSLKHTGGRYGLQTMCEGGGQANVLIVERA
jgi:acetyl-CoA C-acetyltransferase